MIAFKERLADTEGMNLLGRSAKRGRARQGQDGVDVRPDAPLDQNLGEGGGEQTMSGGRAGVQEQREGQKAGKTRARRNGGRSTRHLQTGDVRVWSGEENHGEAGRAARQVEENSTC